ncbi:hypothetical protein AN958_07256 [Leucoagaricus sp. SymC.cos]|nr:hypothetical protein AN958_07256 [Leucoagaricus sp. SymC.cos]
MLLPANASLPQLVFANKVWLQGLVLTGVLYGIVVMHCCSCMSLLASNCSKLLGASTDGQRRWLRLYVGFLFVISTTGMALHWKGSEIAFIHHSGDYGGPALYTANDTSAVAVAVAVCFIVLQWAADGLLMWRCLSFFTRPDSPSGSSPKLTSALIVLLAMINVGLSMLFVVAAAVPASFGSGTSALMLLYGFYTFLLNTGITIAIVTALLRQRRRVEQLFGPGHGKAYLNIISIVVESAAVIVVYDLFWLVPAILQHPISLIGFQIGIMVQIIPPLMIIQRVARGTAWPTQRPKEEWSLSSISCPGFRNDHAVGEGIESIGCADRREQPSHSLTAEMCNTVLSG